MQISHVQDSKGRRSLSSISHLSEEHTPQHAWAKGRYSVQHLTPHYLLCWHLALDHQLDTLGMSWHSCCACKWCTPFHSIPCRASSRSICSCPCSFHSPHCYTGCTIPCNMTSFGEGTLCNLLFLPTLSRINKNLYIHQSRIESCCFFLLLLKLPISFQEWYRSIPELGSHDTCTCSFCPRILHPGTWCLHS